MLQKLIELYRLLTKEQRKKLLSLQVFVILMAFSEIIGVLSIGPFMAVVGDVTQLEGEGRLARIYELSGFRTPEEFLFWMGVGVLIMLTGASLVSMYTIWRLSMYGNRVGGELSSRLYRHYMHQPWLFHSCTSSSQLTNQVSQECLRVTNELILPMLEMNAKLVMVSLMAMTIFIYNPIVAMTGISIFVVAYCLLYWTVRRKLVSNGKDISASQSNRFKLMNEGFGGIKDALLLGRQQVFIDQFEKASQSFSRSRGNNMALGQTPRYAIELMAFGAVIFLILYLLSAHKGNLGTILPILSVYALAGFKLLPAFQQIYKSISQIRGNLAAFEAISEDLHASSKSDEPRGFNNSRVSMKKGIKLQDVIFTYPGKQESALNRVSLEIKKNQIIGIVGASGSGKSTAIDLILGLIRPQEGHVLIDDQPLTLKNLRAWQNSLGFVPQAIFLADSSILENIAFGLPVDSIDTDKARQAASMAHLDELLETLPEGLGTRVGERGVQLSGGQRQRIGIARALYHDADVLVLDEATSALDSITEKLIMDAIHDFSGKKTIIMIAHRLTTVKQCDRIYMMADGQVVDYGNYDELAERNMIFKRMAEHHA
ncbi:HlyD family secretion protein [Halomonas organivorans]|uniref:HlyD family secretion protein n=1 Tax=Halomonas organivorans TaxID=257772 RepID=A0A7W5G454_9GAMM|nr:ABC transporter ATP-binding protein [Halomonas organivorans]MBB3140058.1 HlyD family secretion protein [Halomonas organivorans]